MARPALKQFFTLYNGLGFAALVAFTLLCSVAATATTFAPVPFNKRVSEVPNIVQGTVGKKSTQWIGKQIHTVYELNVEKAHRGRFEGKSILVSHLGGEVNGVSLNVPGGAAFKTGESVVVFLNESQEVGADQAYPLRGLKMGKLKVIQNDRGEELIVGPAIKEPMSLKKFERLVAMGNSAANEQEIEGNSAEHAKHQRGGGHGHGHSHSHHAHQDDHSGHDHQQREPTSVESKDYNRINLIIAGVIFVSIGLIGLLYRKIKRL